MRDQLRGPGKQEKMTTENTYGWAIRPDLKACLTHVSVEISAPAVFRNWKRFDWPKYVRGCRESLHRVSAAESIDLVISSTDLDFERELITHQICVRGILPGMLSLRIIRALRPPPGYSTLDFLKRALERGWRMEQILKACVESQRLKRHGRDGKLLEDPLPAQLLARAVMGTNWSLRISPLDSPWAYINRATHRIFNREYPATHESGWNGNDFDQKLFWKGMESGDELHLEDTSSVCRAAGLTEDLIAVLRAQAEGLTWRQMPEYLTDQTGILFDRRRVEAVRGNLRRRKNKLRSAGLAASQWKPSSTSGTVFRERLPDGKLWNGRWTFAHRYHGEELEILGDVIRQGLSKLFRKK